MAITKYLDVFSGHDLIETVVEDGITPSDLIKKHSDKPGVLVKRRTEKTIEKVYDNGCPNGVCPVKVSYK